MTSAADHSWHVYRGTGVPHPGIDSLPPPPPWRRFDGVPADPTQPDGLVLAHAADLGGTGRPGAVERAKAYRPDPTVVDTVNAAVYLRRPLLVTGRPGTGKSTLASSLAYELGLGPVLSWPITSRSTLAEALYRYDAIGRLQESNLHWGRATRTGEPDDADPADPAARPAQPIPTRPIPPGPIPPGAPGIGGFLRLGPLGTALLPWARPRVLLIDELDKSDIDLSNDLLNVFEEGEYEIPELTRLPDQQQPVSVRLHDSGSCLIDRGRVRCRAFPLVVITSNGERDFPPAFRRRCLSLSIEPPTPARLREIVAAQLGEQALADSDELLDAFLQLREISDVSTDQLLNLVFLASTGQRPSPQVRERLQEILLRPLGAQA